MRYSKWILIPFAFVHFVVPHLISTLVLKLTWFNVLPLIYPSGLSLCLNTCTSGAEFCATTFPEVELLFLTVDALGDAGEHVRPVVGHDLRVGVAVEVEHGVEDEGALDLDAALGELRHEEGADELEAAVAAGLLHVEEDEDDGVLVAVAAGAREGGRRLEHRGHARTVVVVPRRVRHLARRRRTVMKTEFHSAIECVEIIHLLHTLFTLSPHFHEASITLQ